MVSSQNELCLSVHEESWTGSQNHLSENHLRHTRYSIQRLDHKVRLSLWEAIFGIVQRHTMASKDERHER
jgi:hypothetical protein